MDESASASRPTTHTSWVFNSAKAAGSPPTRAMGMYSTAPAAAFVTAGEMWADR